MPSLTLISDHSDERLLSLLQARTPAWAVNRVGDFSPFLAVRSLPKAEDSRHLVHLNLCTPALRERFYATSAKNRCTFAEEVREDLKQAVLYLHDLGYRALINTFVLPQERLFGNFSVKERLAFVTQIRRLNFFVVEMASANPELLVLDIEHLAGAHGTRVWSDERYWFHSKYPCKPPLIKQIAEQLAAILNGLSGRGIKCIVVDLDNTLWGGVIGDDGIEGIRLGGQGEGEAYQNFQHYLKSLKERGLLLAVCSKNDESNARLPFQQHNAMILQENDFVAFKANWAKKSENLQAIAAEINLGLDSFLFLDDSPFEREEVRTADLGVTIPDLPQDPALYISCIESSASLETVSQLSETDLVRTELYLQETKRSSLAKEAGSHAEFLKSLNMMASLAPAESAELERVAQLIQRSNQFNLRTQRLGLEKLQKFAICESAVVLRCMLKDRFGDHGIIGAVCCQIYGDELFIEEFVMSCRVLSRGTEQFICNSLVTFAASRRLSRIVGEYIPSPKNQLVASLYENLGFAKCPNSPDRFILDVRSFLYHQTSITPLS